MFKSWSHLMYIFCTACGEICGLTSPKYGSLVNNIQPRTAQTNCHVRSCSRCGVRCAVCGVRCAVCGVRCAGPGTERWSRGRATKGRRLVFICRLLETQTISFASCICCMRLSDDTQIVAVLSNWCLYPWR